MRIPLMCAAAALGAATSFAQSTDETNNCKGLETLALPDLTVTTVETLEDPVAHCKLTGTLGREIGLAIWLPADWNGKFVMGGGGGFGGSIQNQAMALGALQRGYATAGTDTGHQAGGIDGSWALNNLERLVNYGHVAIHRVTEVAKHVVAKHYASGPERSYFAGCSNGGRQAMAFSQRYPTDFDAILAGAPGLRLRGPFRRIPECHQAHVPEHGRTRRAALDRRGSRAARHCRAGAMRCQRWPRRRHHERSSRMRFRSGQPGSSCRQDRRHQIRVRRAAPCRRPGSSGLAVWWRGRTGRLGQLG